MKKLLPAPGVVFRPALKGSIATIALLRLMQSRSCALNAGSVWQMDVQEKKQNWWREYLQLFP